MITVQLKEEDLVEAYKLHMRWGPWMWFISCLSTVVYVGLALWLIFWVPNLVSIGMVPIVIVTLFWILMAFIRVV